MTTAKSLQVLRDALRKTRDDKQAITKMLADVVKEIELLQLRKQDLNSQVSDLNDTIDKLSIDINASIQA